MNGFQPNCAALSASFSYDALGRRIQKTVNGQTTTFLHDGLDVIAEIGNNTATYLRTDNIDEAIARYSASGDRFLLTDMLGSTQVLTDRAGSIATSYSYSPFGETQATGQASDNPTQYTGRENDGTGMYYYRARYYAPELARFISSDPIGLGGGFNTYSYVGNNPLYWIDPLGLAVQICSRPAEILKGLVDHYWVTTDTRSVGLQGDPNVRVGDQYEFLGTPTFPTDHSGDKPTSCEVQNNVDEQCVNTTLDNALGNPQGGFGPTSNCKQFAFSVVNKCRTGPQILPSQ